MTLLPFPKMTPELQAYLEFDPTRDEGGHDEAFRLRNRVPAALYLEYHRMEIDSAFVPENERPDTRHEELSPSGKYKLVTVSYAVKGGFGRTQGRVYRQGSDEPIALVNRNYSDFLALFVEGHPNGHDYLVCGEDYQGQTIIELDTGRRRDYLPDDAAKGWGFCFTGCEFHAESQLLIVDGCFWACPFETRFYDFSDPLGALPHLEAEEPIDLDSKSPTIEADGSILCFQSRETKGEDDARVVVATKVFRREGPKLVLVREDVTEEEAQRRAAAKAASDAYDAWWENYKASDPLYLRSLELVQNPALRPADHCGVGQTYTGWCDHWKGDERRVCRRIHQNKKPNTGYTFDLEIAHLTGPVKLQIYKDGGSASSVFFEHSVEGVEKAFAHALALLEGGEP